MRKAMLFRYGRSDLIIDSDNLQVFTMLHKHFPKYATIKRTNVAAKILLALLALACGSIKAQEDYVASQEVMAARERFQDNKFGIFIHWGIYAMMADGEWNMQVNDRNHTEYEHLAASFYPSRFSAAEWVSAIKASGAKYLTVTSRHHDGFSMFHSDASDYNIVDATPFKRDVIAELAAECHRQGIDLHLYYSHLDWGREDYWPLGRTGHGTGRTSHGEWGTYARFMEQQLTELLTNYGKIGCIWFDGVWDKDEFPRERQPELWGLYSQYELIHRLQPGCLVGNNHHLLPFGGEDIQIFERDIPGQNEAGYSGQGISRLPLETCQTMNGSWGYRMSDLEYKSTEELIRYLVRTAGMNANLLLNVGPRPDGTLPEQAVERLRGIGEWLAANGKSIYGTRGGIIAPQDWGVTTQKDNVLYVHILNLQDSTLTLACGQHKLRKATFLATGDKVAFKQAKDGAVTLTFAAPPQGTDCIVALEFKDDL